MVLTKKQPPHEVTLETIRKAVRALHKPSSEHSDQNVRHEYSVGAIQALLSVLGQMEIPDVLDQARAAIDLRNIMDSGGVPRELDQFFKMALDEL